jgi:predicted HTH transcriptional regulator
MGKMFPKKIDQEFVNQLLLKVEGEQLEFKQQISSQEKIAKTLSAMSNSAGGLILIGVSDQRKLIGIDPDEEHYMIEGANQDFCSPKADLELQVVTIKPESLYEEEKYILLVIVYPSKDRTIYVKQRDGTLRAYRRVGEENLIA